MGALRLFLALALGAGCLSTAVKSMTGTPMRHEGMWSLSSHSPNYDHPQAGSHRTDTTSSDRQSSFAAAVPISQPLQPHETITQARGKYREYDDGYGITRIFEPWSPARVAEQVDPMPHAYGGEAAEPLLSPNAEQPQPIHQPQVVVIAKKGTKRKRKQRDDRAEPCKRRHRKGKAPAKETAGPSSNPPARKKGGRARGRGDPMQKYAKGPPNELVEVPWNVLSKPKRIELGRQRRLPPGRQKAYDIRSESYRKGVERVERDKALGIPPIDRSLHAKIQSSERSERAYLYRKGQLDPAEKAAYTSRQQAYGSLRETHLEKTIFVPRHMLRRRRKLPHKVAKTAREKMQPFDKLTIVRRKRLLRDSYVEHGKPVPNSAKLTIQSYHIFRDVQARKAKAAKAAAAVAAHSEAGPSSRFADTASPSATIRAPRPSEAQTARDLSTTSGEWEPFSEDE